MAIADTITSMQTHTSNAYTMIGYGTDLTGINKNLANLSNTIFEAFLEALRTPDTLFTNLPKKSGTGANITLNDTANAPMRITLGASELTQAGTPTPSSPQDIHTISGSNKVVVSDGNGNSQEAEVDLGYKNYLDFLNMNMPSVEQTATGERLDNGFKAILTTDGQYKYASWYTKNASEWLGKDMYISCNVKASGGNNGRLLLRWFNTSNNAIISQIANLEATGGTFTMPSTLPNANAQVLISFYANQSSATHSTNDYVEYTNIMVNEGTTAKTYTPYNEALEYCKISTYEDKFIKIKSDIKLPSAYTQVEYIEATGTQYIDTGYTPVQNDEFEIKNINITSSNGGAIISAGIGSYQLILLKQAQHTYYRYFSSGGAEDIVVSEYTGNTITINKNGELYLDGTLKSTKAYGGAVDTTLQLFRRANASSYLTGSIGEVKITNNGTTKKHLISCKRNSDNVIGMYDLVNNQFYTNAGTGTFTAGIELNKWYIKKNIGKVVLDGTENWGTNASWNYTNTNCYVYTWNLAPTTMLSNYYKYNSSAYNNDISGQMGIVWGGTLLLRIDKTLASDVADFKTWLSTHNTTIMYPLSTPTYTQITGTLAEQLENVYKNMLSQEGVTNISQVNNDLAFGLSVSALESI